MHDRISLKGIALFGLGVLSGIAGARTASRRSRTCPTTNHDPRPRAGHTDIENDGSASQPVGPQMAGPNVASKRVWFLPAALVILALLTALGGYSAYHKATTQLPAPVPKEDGAILILLRAPDISAHITLTMNTAGHFSLRLDSSDGVGRFLAVFSGETLIDPEPYSEPATGSQFESLVLPRHDKQKYYRSGAFSTWCVTHPSQRCDGHDSIYSISGYHPTAAEAFQIESGIFKPKNSGSSPIRHNIDGKFRKQFVRSEGSTVVGRTPALAIQGLAHFSHFRTSIDLPFSSVQLSGALSGRWYPPKKATVSVEMTSDELFSNPSPTIPVGYRLDSSSPSTASSGELRWTLGDLESATWTITDLRKEREQSRALFIAGILLGAATGLLAPAIERVLSFLASQNSRQ
jgi:hypothetical protein